MENSLFSTKDIVKYLIVVGLIYYILKIIPSQQMTNRDLILLIVVIGLGFVSVDCLFFKKNQSETFANQESSELEALIKRRADELNEIFPTPNSTTVLSPPISTSVRTETASVSPTPMPTSVKTETTSTTVQQPQNENNLQIINNQRIACSLEVNRIKKDLEDQIEALKSQLRTSNSSSGPQNQIALRYFNSLISELADKGLLSSTEIENINIKLKSKLMSMEEIISSMEMLKKEGKSKISGTDGKVKNDMIYNELPSDFYTPIGDKIANDWDNDYTLLNTNKWQVPMVRPPVCVNTSPCQVCPTDLSSQHTPLKNWDDSRYVTSNTVNKKWAKDQASA